MTFLIIWGYTIGTCAILVAIIWFLVWLNANYRAWLEFIGWCVAILAATAWAAYLIWLCLL